MDDKSQYKFKTICFKENMHLKREKSNNIYLLQFLAENSNVNLYTMINLDIYNLMFTLNKDNFEKIELHGMVSTTLSSGSGSGSGLYGLYGLYVKHVSVVIQRKTLTLT